VNLADATIDDVVTEDALTAIDRLRSVDRVGSVFVAGHSFGGVLAPRIATRDGNLAGVVMLAPGPADSFADTIVRQQRHLTELDGTVTDAEQTSINRTEQVAQKIRTLDIGDDEILLNFGGDEYYRTFQAYDQASTFAELSIPRFVAQGGSDWQVTVEEDLQVWRGAAGDQQSVTIEVYPELNHRFQVSTGKETRQEYFEPDSHVAQRLVADVAAFVTSNA
jgi:dienelactone hydrolase